MSRRLSTLFFILFSTSLLAQNHGKTSSEKNKADVDWMRLMSDVDKERSRALTELNKSRAKARGEKTNYVYDLSTLVDRRKIDKDSVDSCFLDAAKKDTSFAEVIQKSIDHGFAERIIATNSYIDSEDAYNLLPHDQRAKVGMMSHEFCATKDSFLPELAHSLRSTNVPPKAIADKLNRYLLHMNYLRGKLKNPSSSNAFRDSYNKFKAYQSIMMSCLSYAESLASTEGSHMEAIFSDLFRRGHIDRSKKPKGVSLAIDRPTDHFIGNTERKKHIEWGLPVSLATFNGHGQRISYSEELLAKVKKLKSKTEIEKLKKEYILNKIEEIKADQAAGMSDEELSKKYFNPISDAKWVAAGVYQFKFGNLDTDKGDLMDSNIGPCVDQWNGLFGHKCPIQHSLSGYAKALLSSAQTFNIFCGTQKIMQMYNVQVNTKNPSMTSPQNLKADGTLKNPKDRCVHPFWYGGRSYNHFGPLSNSVPYGQIPGWPTYPGNLRILMECVENNSMAFGKRL